MKLNLLFVGFPCQEKLFYAPLIGCGGFYLESINSSRLRSNRHHYIIKLINYFFPSTTTTISPFGGLFV